MNQKILSISNSFAALLFSFCLLLPAITKAQADLAAVQTAPSNGQTITSGSPFNVTLTVKNNSFKAIAASDVIQLTCYVENGAKKDTLACATGPFTGIAIPTGGSVGPVTVSCTYNFTTPATGVKICQSVFVVGQSEITPADNTSCATGIILKVGGGGTGGHNTGTPKYRYAKAGTYDNPIPFNHTNDKAQLLYRSAELVNTSNIQAPSGSITKVYFKTNDATSIKNLSNVVLKMAQTTDTSFPPGLSAKPFNTDVKQVFSSSAYSISTPGWIEFTLQTPFVYDNKKNLIVEVSGKDGFQISQDNSVGVRRLSGTSAAISGTPGGGIYEFGFDMSATSVETVAKNNGVAVYPNPADAELNVAVKNKTSSAMIVYDLSGRTIAKHELNNETTTISTKDLSSGVYFYKIVDAKAQLVSVGRFAVQH